MTVTIHIDRLILDGLEVQNMRDDLLAEAIRTELVARVSANGLPAQLRASSMRPYAAGSFEPPMHEAPAEGIGAEIGGALYGSLDT
jgi:hypothetical protein